MARHVHRRLTAAEAAKVDRDMKLLAREKGALIQRGSRMLKRRETLQRAMTALKAERQAQGITLGELARRTGISKSTLSRLESDGRSNPTIATLARIAAALGRQIVISVAPAA